MGLSSINNRETVSTLPVVFMLALRNQKNFKPQNESPHLNRRRFRRQSDSTQPETLQRVDDSDERSEVHGFTDIAIRMQSVTSIDIFIRGGGGQHHHGHSLQGLAVLHVCHHTPTVFLRQVEVAKNPARHLAFPIFSSATQSGPGLPP